MPLVDSLEGQPTSSSAVPAHNTPHSITTCTFFEFVPGSSINGSEILFQDEIQARVLTFQNPDYEDHYNQHFGLVNFFVPN
jgi:hypothetical protein